MINILETMKTLEAYGDITVDKRLIKGNTVYDVTVEDFLGFDEEWNEIMREFEDEELVYKFLDALKEQAAAVDGNFYRTYQFDNFAVRLGFGSFDI